MTISFSHHAGCVTPLLCLPFIVRCRILTLTDALIPVKVLADEILLFPAYQPIRFVLIFARHFHSHFSPLRWKKPVWVPAHVVLSYEQCTPALCSSELTTPSSRGGYYVRRATTGYDPHPTLSFPGSQACSSHHGTRGAGCPK